MTSLGVIKTSEAIVLILREMNISKSTARDIFRFLMHELVEAKAATFICIGKWNIVKVNRYIPEVVKEEKENRAKLAYEKILSIKNIKDRDALILSICEEYAITLRKLLDYATEYRRNKRFEDTPEKAGE